MSPRRPGFQSTLRALTLLLVLGGVTTARAQEQADPPGRVARLNLASGTVSIQPAGSNSWVDDAVNRPVTVGDKIWVDRDSRAELHVGSAALRLGSNTGVGILNIDDSTVQVRLTAGTLRLRVRALDTNQTFEVATPLAAVSLLQVGSYRIDVSDAGDELKIEVDEGQVAVTNRGRADVVSAGELAVYNADDDRPRIRDLPRFDAFDRWAADRDAHEDRARSSRYLSREMTGYEDLDDYGSWREVPEYGPIWVPAVRAGWAPYREGHWAWVAPWGWTWIDDAPWGFAPFHYGRWVNYRGDWCWTPGPRRAVPVYAPALVGWVGGSHWSVGISVGSPVGWFPLGWNEVYVPSYRVSNTYVRNVNVTNIHVTNTYVNNYIVNNTTVNNGTYVRKTTGDRDLGRDGGMRFRNQAVPGAVTATTQAAFTSARPVAQNRVDVPRGALTDRAAAAAPTVAPTAVSVGRPSANPARSAPQIWERGAVTRAPVPAGVDAAMRRPQEGPANPMPGQGDRGPRGGGAAAPIRQPAGGQDVPSRREDRPFGRDNPSPAGGRGDAPVRQPQATPDAPPRREDRPFGRDNPSPAGGRGDAPVRQPQAAPDAPPRREDRPLGRDSAPPPPGRIEAPARPAVRDDRPMQRDASPNPDRGGQGRDERPPVTPRDYAPPVREAPPREMRPPVERPAIERAPPPEYHPPVREAPPPVREAPRIEPRPEPRQEVRPAPPRPEPHPEPRPEGHPDKPNESRRNGDPRR